MNKTKTNVFVDIFAAIVFLFSAFSGVVLKFFLPRGSGRIGETFFNLSRDFWLALHDISSLLLIALVFLHIILHWSWILNIPKMIKQK